MNEEKFEISPKIVDYTLKLLRERKEYHEKCDGFVAAGAYETAMILLRHMVNENWEMLRQFDYYGED